MTLIQSVMGTEGKRASASYDTILVPGGSLRFLVSLTNSLEFLQTYGETLMKGLRRLLRCEASFSCGAPMCDVMTRAGWSFAGLWALMATEALGVVEPEG